MTAPGGIDEPGQAGVALAFAGSSGPASPGHTALAHTKTAERVRHVSKPHRRNTVSGALVAAENHGASGGSFNQQRVLKTAFSNIWGSFQLDQSCKTRLQATKPVLLAPSGMSVGSLAAVVQPLVLPMLDARGDLRFGRTAGSQSVRHEGPWLTPSFHEFAQETMGSSLVAVRLDQNFENVAVRVDGPPKPVRLSFDPNDEFVEVLFVGC